MEKFKTYLKKVAAQKINANELKELAILRLTNQASLKYLFKDPSPKIKKRAIMINQTVPNVVFKTRVRNETLNTENPFEWKDLSSNEIFSGKKVVLFSLPGAFTPTCSTSHLPRFEALHEEFKAQGVDQVVCLSVNDAFVMYQWGQSQNAKHVFLLPDGNGEFTRKMGMLVNKTNLGFGDRSWRYSMVVNDGKIEKMFIEDGFTDNAGSDPFEVSDADTILNYLKS